MKEFYSDHWKEIEADRLARYETMFAFRVDQEPIIDSLALGQALHLLDFGCGPGFLATEIARRLEGRGRVTAVDLNAEFIARAGRRTHDEGVHNIEFRHLTSDSLPLTAASVDRVLVKNVLEYVPSVETVLAEFHRVLMPEGQLQIIDSDWGFVIVEPWGKARTDQFFEAASQAFKEPFIGRRIAGSLARSGFREVKVRMLASVDLKGRGLNVLLNMKSYIEQFGTLEAAQLDEMFAELEAAIPAGEFMFVLPQFFVSAVR